VHSNIVVNVETEKETDFYIDCMSMRTRARNQTSFIIAWDEHTHQK